MSPSVGASSNEMITELSQITHWITRTEMTCRLSRSTLDR